MSYNPYLPDKNEKELRKLYAREQKDATPLSQDDLKRYKDMVAQYEKDKVDAYWKDTMAQNMKLIEYDGHTIAIPGNKIPRYDHPELVFPTDRYERNYRYAVENEHAERQLAVCAMSQMFCKDEQQLHVYREIETSILMDNKDTLYDISNKPREMQTLRERELLEAAEERVPEMVLEIKESQKQELKNREDEIAKLMVREKHEPETLSVNEIATLELAKQLLDREEKEKIKTKAREEENAYFRRDAIEETKKYGGYEDLDVAAIEMIGTKVSSKRMSETMDTMTAKSNDAHNMDIDEAMRLNNSGEAKRMEQCDTEKMLSMDTREYFENIEQTQQSEYVYEYTEEERDVPVWARSDAADIEMIPTYNPWKS